MRSNTRRFAKSPSVPSIRFTTKRTFTLPYFPLKEHPHTTSTHTITSVTLHNVFKTNLRPHEHRTSHKPIQAIHTSPCQTYRPKTTAPENRRNPFSTHQIQPLQRPLDPRTSRHRQNHMYQTHVEAAKKPAKYRNRLYQLQDPEHPARSILTHSTTLRFLYCSPRARC